MRYLYYTVTVLIKIVSVLASSSAEVLSWSQLLGIRVCYADPVELEGITTISHGSLIVFYTAGVAQSAPREGQQPV